VNSQRPSWSNFKTADDNDNDDNDDDDDDDDGDGGCGGATPISRTISYHPAAHTR